MEIPIVFGMYLEKKKQKEKEKRKKEMIWFENQILCLGVLKIRNELISNSYIVFEILLKLKEFDGNWFNFKV